MDRLKNIITASRLDVAKLAKIVTLILVIFVIYRMAKITWLVVEPVAITPSSWQLPPANHQGGSSSSVDFADYQWFGQATTKTITVELKPKTVTKAPKTKLNLTLSGLVASSDAKHSMAIVEYQGKQDTYGIDDKIGGTRAVIHEIHPDRLILKNSGKYEALMLGGFYYNCNDKSPATRPKPGKKFSISYARKKG